MKRLERLLYILSHLSQAVAFLVIAAVVGATALGWVRISMSFTLAAN